MKIKLDKEKWMMIGIVAASVVIILLIVFIVVDLLKKANQAIKYTFSPEQEKFLVMLHPSVQNKFRELVHKMQQKGWTVIFTSTYRTFAHQARLKAENSKNASPGRSRHNYGFAIDINLRKDGVQLRKASSKASWEATGIPQMAREMGFKWGGDFANYHDPVHFDIPVPSTDELYQKAVAQFGSDPDLIKGNEVKL